MKETAVLRVAFSHTKCKQYRIKALKGGQKTPAELALEYFDFFYKPIFKNRWNSIRLGLLSEQKLCALMNSCTNYDQVYTQLVDSGAVDLSNLLASSEGYGFEQKGRADGVGTKTPFHAVMGRQIRRKVTCHELPTSRKSNVAVSTLRDADNWDAAADEHRTSREALHSFVPSSDRVVRTRDDVEISSVAKNEGHFCPADVDILPDNDVQYPDALRVLVYPRGDVTRFRPAPASAENVPSFYLLDASTIFSVVALNLQLDDRVLDMCMSPGGTSLAILQTLLPSKLVSNDVTGKLRGRRTLDNFLPATARNVRDRIQLTTDDLSEPQDSSASGDLMRMHDFDKVLVNAPCTFDRQAVQVDQEFGQDFNLFADDMNAEKLRLPGRQALLLKAGLERLKVGGDLVYTVHSLSPIQGDSVVDDALTMLLKEQPCVRIVVRDLSSLAAKFCRSGVFRFFPFCRYGELILPNMCSNFGPLYACKLSRIE